MSATAGTARSAAAVVRRLLGSVLGVGLLPAAPGTWGSVATVLLVALLAGVAGLFEGLLPAGFGPGAALAVVLAASLGCLALGVYVEDDWGRGDPGAFVLDEVAGQLLALLPLLRGTPTAGGLVAGLLLFRLFDVWKPFPIGRAQALPGGLGIVADDLLAGAAAALLLLAGPWLRG